LAAPRKRYLLAICAAALLVGACGKQSGSSVDRNFTVSLRRGLGGEPASLDPAAATDGYSAQLLQDLYEGLTTESPSGEVVPGVASSWTVDPSGRQYRFILRSNARWSNGEPVRARDFVFAWQRVLNPKQGSPVSNDLRLIVGASAIIAGRAPISSLGATAESDNLLIVNLEQPAPYFPELLSHSSAFPIFSEESARTHDASKWISNGPFVLSEWQPETKVALARNSRYWDVSNVRIDRVQYQISPDRNSQFAAYRAGQLDITDTVPGYSIEALIREHSSEVVIAPYLATAYYALNLSEGPFAANIKLRKALAMAIDRPQLVNLLGLGQMAAYGFVPPATWNYEPQRWAWSNDTDENRIAEARRLYRAAGYSTNTKLHLRLLFNSNPAIKQTAIVIAAMWKETLGIETELIDEEFRVFLQSRDDKKRWDIVRLAWNADYNDATSFLDVFRNKSPNNSSGYSSPSFDKLLDEASSTSSAEVRRSLLEGAERMMLEDYPVIPLYFLVSKRLVKPYVLGVLPNPMDRIGSKTLVIRPH
jgi:oligopeptide transport system substrate-binding protein